MEHIIVECFLGAWGMLCGLYVSYRLLKDAKRRYIAAVRRAKRVYIDVDAQNINGTQLVCRVTINGHRAVLLYVSSATPIAYSVNGENDTIPTEEQHGSTTVQ